MTIRGILWFILGVLLFCAIGQLAYGQDFTNLPEEMKGKITEENVFLYPFNANFIALLATPATNDVVYWVTCHKQSGHNVSAGWVRYNGMDIKDSRHWILKDDIWQVTDETGESEWIKANDKMKRGV